MGQTPWQLVQQFKENNPEYANQKIGYAGRLDPLAYGTMILLIGEENKHRDHYLSLNKTYRFEVLFGATTDSYDLLGLVTRINNTPVPADWKAKTREFLQKLIGRHLQPYPPYSTKTVQGKSLYKWAQENRIDEIKIPTKEIEIFTAQLRSSRTMASQDLYQEIIRRVNLVTGDFRQPQILNKWAEFFLSNPDQEFILAWFEVSCSSGTYIRSIAHNLGQKLGCGALAFEIYRTKLSL